MIRDVCGKFLLVGGCAVALLLSACGQNGATATDLPNPDGLQAGATSDYVPVAMVLLPDGVGLCTGTFISENTVLTASHCANASGAYQVVTSFGTFITSDRITFGPGTVNDPNDIALLVFSSPVASRASGQVYDIGNRALIGETIQLVGFGCNDISSREGTGTKRTGSNVIFQINDFINFTSPIASGTVGSGALTKGNDIFRIGGPLNVAYSCFGDSGGPALAMTGNTGTVIAVTHAGGPQGNAEVSEYVDLVNRNDNRNFLSVNNDTYNLGIHGL